MLARGERWRGKGVWGTFGDGTVPYLDCGGGYKNLLVWRNGMELHTHTKEHAILVKFE